jgi:hypothetical protein
VKRHSSPYTLPVLFMLAAVLFARAVRTEEPAKVAPEATQQVAGTAKAPEMALTWAQSNR